MGAGSKDYDSLIGEVEWHGIGSLTTDLESVMETGICELETESNGIENLNREAI